MLPLLTTGARKSIEDIGCALLLSVNQSPVAKCKSKPQKKLSNHISKFHPEYSVNERRRLLRKAKVVNQYHIKKDPMQQKLPFKTGTSTPYPERFTGATKTEETPRSVSAKGKGQTRFLHYFGHDHPELMEFKKHLMGLGGKRRSDKAAHDIVRDISKMLYFGRSEELDWGTITKKERLLAYMEEVQFLGVGPEGQLSKLDRVCDAYQFLRRKENPTWDQQMSASMLDIATWKKTLRQEKNALNVERLEKASELDADMSTISNIVDNQDMWVQFSNTVDQIRDDEDVPETDLKLAMGIVMISIKLKSLQRPGAVMNCTMEEYHSAVAYDNVTVIKVREHKTSKQGSAKLTLDSQLMARLKLYVKYIRPRLVDPENKTNYLFILPGSRKIEKLRNIEKFLEKNLKLDVPTSTMARKIGATCAVKKLDYKDHSLINRQMSHSGDVSRKYYEAITGPKDAADAFRMMETLRHETEHRDQPQREEEGKINSRWSVKDTRFVERKFAKAISKGITPHLDACRNLGLDKNPKQVGAINSNHAYKPCHVIVYSRRFKTKSVR